MLSYGAVEAQQDVPQSLPLVHSEPVELEKTKSPSTSKQAQQSESKTNFASCLIYAIINVIIAVPGYEEISCSGFSCLRWFSLMCSPLDSTDMLQV